MESQTLEVESPKPLSVKERMDLQEKVNMCSAPVSGFGYNPLLSYGRNNVCLCGSNKKFKKCCLSVIPRSIPDRLIKEMKGKSFGVQASILLDFVKDQQAYGAKEENKTKL